QPPLAVFFVELVFVAGALGRIDNHVQAPRVGVHRGQLVDGRGHFYIPTRRFKGLGQPVRVVQRGCRPPNAVQLAVPFLAPALTPSTSQTARNTRRPCPPGRRRCAAESRSAFSGARPWPV